MFTYHLPKALYEALPYLYIAGGCVGIVVSDGSLGVWSGLALVGLGIYIRLLRKSFRRRQALELQQIRAKFSRAVR